jgi:hypothetical protein
MQWKVQLSDGKDVTIDGTHLETNRTGALCFYSSPPGPHLPDKLVRLIAPGVWKHVVLVSE